MDPNKTKVSSVMSRDVITAGENDSLTSVMEAMLSRSVSHIPVVDEKRELVGIVSKTDIVSDRALAGDTSEAVDPVKTLRRGVQYELGRGFHLEVPDISVKDVMSKKVYSIADTDSIGQAASMMATHQIHGLPVISARRGLVGFISSLDITSWVARS